MQHAVEIIPFTSCEFMKLSQSYSIQIYMDAPITMKNWPKIRSHDGREPATSPKNGLELLFFLSPTPHLHPPPQNHVCVMEW